MSGGAVNSRFLVLGWPLLCMAGAVGYVEWRMSALSMEIAARPPVAILPVDASVIRIIEENPGVKVEEAIARVRGAGQRLADAGYVVFNASQVYGYPSDIEAQP